MLARPRYLEQLDAAVRRSPVTALLGPRQCGKTTLAGILAEERGAARFDLESRPDVQRLQNPELALGSLEGLVVLDEIQRVPELFNVLRVLVDRPLCRARFLILGSASPDLMRNVSETLAGRVEFIELAGFDLSEAGADALHTLWLRGGFPRSFLADSDEDSIAWREGFIRTFLERDIPQLGITIPAAAMRRFWTMLAHYHGQTWNASELSRSMGLSDKTVRSYLDILTGTFMVRQLQPWYENIGKRQVKAPKIYLRRLGASARAPGPCRVLQSPGASARGCFLGGLRSRTVPSCRATAGGVLLGDTHRRRDRPVLRARRASLRRRGQVQRSADGDPIHAPGPGGPCIGAPLDHLSGRTRLPHR